MTTWRVDKGAALVEFAMIIPLFVVLVFGAIDVGRLLYTRITLHEAVQEGSIYASTNPDDPNGARLRVIDSVDNPMLALADVVVTCPGSAIHVAATHDMDLVTPLWGPSTITLTAEVTADVFASESCVAAP